MKPSRTLGLSSRVRRAAAWATLFWAVTPFVSGQTSPTVEGLSAEVRALRQTVESLQQRVSELEAQLAAVSRAPAAGPVAPAAPTPSARTKLVEEEDPSLFERLLDGMQREDPPSSRLWIDPAKWAQLKKGMTTDEVLAILGEPMFDEPSLNRRIDQVWTYRARNTETRERVIGKVKFENGRIVAIEEPTWP